MKHILTLAGLAFCAVSGAQSYSSFHPINGINGIVVTQSNSNPLQFTVSMDSIAGNDYLTVGGTNYQISNIFGFYALNSAGFTSATGSNQNSWSFTAPGNGTVAGWKGNPAQSAILPGGSLTFDFSSLSPNMPQLGLHVTFANATPNGWGGGSTFFVNVPQSVPEPSSLAFLAGLPLTVLLKRRKK